MVVDYRIQHEHTRHTLCIHTLQWLWSQTTVNGQRFTFTYSFRWNYSVKNKTIENESKLAGFDSSTIADSLFDPYCTAIRNNPWWGSAFRRTFIKIISLNSSDAKLAKLCLDDTCKAAPCTALTCRLTVRSLLNGKKDFRWNRIVCVSVHTKKRKKNENRISKAAKT